MATFRVIAFVPGATSPREIYDIEADGFSPGTGYYDFNKGDKLVAAFPVATLISVQMVAGDDGGVS